MRVFSDPLERKGDMRRSCKAGSWRKSSLVFCLALLGLVLLAGCSFPPQFFSNQLFLSSPGSCRPGQDASFLSTFHSELVDSSGCQVVLTGVNWFGFETSTFAPHGLWARNWQSMLKQMAQLGFNTIRLPYTNQLFDTSSNPQGINYQLNPDLKGLKGLALMDKIIAGAGRLGLKVILDRHDPTA